MTTPTLDPWFQTQYAPRVMDIYKAKGNRLRSLTTPGEIHGEKIVFRFKGKSTRLAPKLKNQPMTQNGINVHKVEMQSQVYASKFIVEDEELKDCGDLGRDIFADAGADAVALTVDDLIMAELNRAAPTAGNGFVSDPTPGGMSLVHALTMSQRLQTTNVPWDGNIFCLLPSLMWNQLLTFKQFTSADYVKDTPLTGFTDTRRWNGVNWLLMPDEYFPIPAANQLDVFMWHKGAIGWGNGWEPKFEWDRNYDRIGWNLHTHFNGGVKALMPPGSPPGIIRARFASDSPITLN